MLVTVNDTKCVAVAELLRSVDVPRPVEEGHGLVVPSDRLPSFYLALVAICHQTSPLGAPALSGVLGSGEVAIGWDYLRCRMAERVAEGQDYSSPAFWRDVTPVKLEWTFADQVGRRTLTGIEERVSLLRDLGEKFAAIGLVSAQQMFELCDATLGAEESAGLLSFLRQFTAYSDPIQKKSAFFLELMRNECGWQYRDPEFLPAPVDYHEVRGHLRIGTVEIVHEPLRQKVLNGIQVLPMEDLAIRGAVRDAIGRIGCVLNTTDSSTLHYLFWNTFRSCCGRDDTHCSSCKCCRLPGRYREAFSPVELRRCVFGSVCSSADKRVKMIEHSHMTHFY